MVSNPLHLNLGPFARVPSDHVVVPLLLLAVAPATGAHLLRYVPCTHARHMDVSTATPDAHNDRAPLRVCVRRDRYITISDVRVCVCVQLLLLNDLRF